MLCPLQRVQTLGFVVDFEIVFLQPIGAQDGQFAIVIPFVIVLSIPPLNLEKKLQLQEGQMAAMEQGNFLRATSFRLWNTFVRSKRKEESAEVERERNRRRSREKADKKREKGERKKKKKKEEREREEA